MQTWMLYAGNARKRLAELPDNSVHVAIGSPPYWGGLRDYHGHDEQLGHEPHPRLYALSLADIFDVLRDKLRPEGTAWLVIGDSYIGSGGPGGDHGPEGHRANADRYPGSRRTLRGLPELDLDPGLEAQLIAAGWSPPSPLKDTDQALAPYEAALELRRRGWWLRADVIWHKRNPKPGGGHLKRPMICHEYVFQLCKSEDTYYDRFAAREPTADGKGLRQRRSVWTTAVATGGDAHFATFPPALVEPMIEASTPEVGVCPDCGAPWVRIEERLSPSTFTEIKANGHFSTETLKRLAASEGKREDKNARTTKGTTPSMKPKDAYTAGWTKTCACPMYRPVPALVLDPFAGTSTTGLAALALGRSYIGIELVDPYVELSARNLTEAFPDVVGEVCTDGQRA